MNQRIQDFMRFLDAAHSVYHAQDYLVKTLEEAGYTALSEGAAWELVPGGKYYVTRGGTAVMAFRIPEGTPGCFMMSASHADRPTFRVKENFELNGPYVRMAVERYGGMIISTWLDRPLSIAGRVLVETENGIRSRLVDIDRDLCMIPNVAIHMNRNVNDGYKWNPAVDTLPLLGSKEAAGKLWDALEDQAGGRILGHDLYLYIREKARIWGMEEEYISSAALDDLECAWGCTQGFLNAKPNAKAIPVLCVFDCEEVGSASVQGAASTLLADTLSRICEAMGLDLRQMLASSFMVSADNGHALHPNHPELSDSTNAPQLGQGVVLKYNASLRYCTDGLSAALFRKVCEKNGVKLQTYFNRADMPGGSTLGNISLNQVSVPTVDIGLPQLAMHSCYETGAWEDAVSLMDAMAAYYSTALETLGDSWNLK